MYVELFLMLFLDHLVFSSQGHHLQPFTVLWCSLVFADEWKVFGWFSNFKPLVSEVNSVLRVSGLLSSTHLFPHLYSIWILWSFYHVVVLTLHVNDCNAWQVPLPWTWRSPPVAVVLCWICIWIIFSRHVVTWSQVVKYAIWDQFSLSSAWCVQS